MSVRFVNEDGEESHVVNHRTGGVRTVIRWDRIMSLLVAIGLIVWGFSLVWGMLMLATEPLPPCNAVTIQHACSGPS